jgi:RimJ/RimL family protein N-acetyltransferase
VLRDNSRAIRFYEKLGYLADGTQDELERGGVKRWKIRLRKTLPVKVESAA